MNVLLLAKSANLALRFFLELCALAALAYWGFQTGKGVMKGILGIGSPLLLAAVWGAFGSPKALVQLPAPVHLLVEILVFGIPALALYAAGKPGLAWLYGGTAALNRILLQVLGDH